MNGKFYVSWDLVIKREYYKQNILNKKQTRCSILNGATNIVSANIQPLQNIGVLNSIAEKFSQDEQLVWVKFHIGKGFAALEKQLKDYAGKYATGDEVLLADIFLAPQLHACFNGLNLDKSEFPLLARLHEEYSQIPAFQDAMPEKQPDSPSQSTEKNDERMENTYFVSNK
ncbi:hypothetical protein UlMin_038422 [Ulmus minor]